MLHLARTTKDLRAILMKRSSISIWKRARSHFDDLPDCPDDLSEPQYAELLFGKACTVSLVFIFSGVIVHQSLSVLPPEPCIQHCHLECTS